VLVTQKKTLMLIMARVKKSITKGKFSFFIPERNLFHFVSLLDFFEKEYSREFEKFWKSSRSHRGGTDGNTKDTTIAPKVIFVEDSFPNNDLFTCHIMVKIKVRKEISIFVIKFSTIWLYFF